MSTINCSIDNCIRPKKTRGYCDAHYHELYRHGYIDENRKSPEHHGLTGSPEYTIWLMMRFRCNNPKAAYYKDYGGRGIKVCKRWDSFTNFLQDVGKRPKNMTLDRINVNKDYEPSNVKWSNGYEQAWNKRKSKRNTSGYIGVYENRNPKWNEKRWFTKISLEDGQIFYMGRFDDVEQAALAFDTAAIFFRGNNAVTNILKLQ